MQGKYPQVGSNNIKSISKLQTIFSFNRHTIKKKMLKQCSN